MRNFMTCPLHLKLLDASVKEDQMGGTYNTHVSEKLL
jgi:hypothetical protein